MTRLPLLVLPLMLAGCGLFSKGDVESASTNGPAPVSAPATPTPAAPEPATPVASGLAMDPARTIAANAAAAANLSTLSAALQAAGLTETLASAGPFTLFAPTNEAFARLAPGTLDTLLKPANKASLVRVLTYHVVAGTITAEQLVARIRAGNGAATLSTVAGDPLTASMQGADVVALTDVNGNKSYIQTADVRQSNGVIHVVNGVLVPKLS